MTTTDPPSLKTAREGAACVIMLDRPEKRNAVSRAMMDGIAAAALAASTDPAVAAIVLTGGTEVFSAGGDLDEVAALETSEDTRGYVAGWHGLTATLEGLSTPVIAAIEGPCITGGLELALACDLRIAGAEARFAVSSARIGTLAGAGGTQRLPRLVGTAAALELLFSAEPIDAAEAHRIGLVNRVVAAGEALPHALALAELYAERAPLGLAFAKRAVHRGMAMPLDHGLALEAELVAEIYATSDKREGVAAFLEKRKPKFRGE
jgi:enoyl-CoA hydratase/carnithine racemase